MTSMRTLLLRSVVLMIMAAMLGGHVTELLDHWDHTARTGEDSDYSFVLIAACAGAAFILAKSNRLVYRLVRLLAESAPCILRSTATVPASPRTFAFDLSPPPATAPIRI
jgi:hypothetical protein